MHAPDWPAQLAREAIDLFEQINVWDEPPLFFIVFDDGPHPFMVSTHVWSAAPPHRVLTVLAEAIRMAGPPPSSETSTILGVMLVAEGWMATESSTKDRTYWATHSIADDPAGREIAFATVVTIDGRTHTRQLERGGQATDLEGGEGCIIDALTEICHALTVTADA